MRMTKEAENIDNADLQSAESAEAEGNLLHLARGDGNPLLWWEDLSATGKTSQPFEQDERQGLCRQTGESGAEED